MPVFCLTPIEGAQSVSRWRASTIWPNCVWVWAENEADARRQVQLATTSAVKRASKTAEAQSPWTDSCMVTCKRDDSVAVARGVIRVRDGTLLPVNGKREYSWPRLEGAAWVRR